MQTDTAGTYRPASLRADFSQTLDRSRPRNLLTADPLSAIALQYRYTDTGETVTVPNIWYNQTVESNIERLRYYTDRYARQIQKLEEQPPADSSPATVRLEISRYQAQATASREAADKLEREGESFFFQVADYLVSRRHS